MTTTGKTQPIQSTTVAPQGFCANCGHHPTERGGAYQAFHHELRIDVTRCGGAATPRTPSLAASYEVTKAAAAYVGVAPFTAQEPLQMARVLTALRDAADRRIEITVIDARRQGDSWAAIGAALGITRQAAQQRYRWVG